MVGGRLPDTPMTGRPRDVPSPGSQPTSTKRPYNARWRKARLTFLLREPLCRMCKAVGRTTPATVVDHVVPHKGDSALFWDTSNWQPLCKPHHDSVKQAEERGTVRGCDESGRPFGRPGW